MAPKKDQRHMGITLDEELYRRFRESCWRRRATMTGALRELMARYADETAATRPAEGGVSHE